MHTDLPVCFALPAISARAGVLVTPPVQPSTTRYDFAITTRTYCITDRGDGAFAAHAPFSARIEPPRLGTGRPEALRHQPVCLHWGAAMRLCPRAQAMSLPV